MAEIRAMAWGKKSCLDWETFAPVEGGFAIQWTKGASRKAAYHWFYLNLFREAWRLKRCWYE